MKTTSPYRAHLNVFSTRYAKRSLRGNLFLRAGSPLGSQLLLTGCSRTNRLPRAVTSAALSVLFCFGLMGLPLQLHANDIEVTNTRLVAGDSPEYRLVEFDLSWNNSWRVEDLVDGDGHATGNWDAAWVFVKYRTADGEWTHAKLTVDGHSAGSVRCV